MNAALKPRFAEGVFRASRGYRIVLFDRLGKRERKSLGDLRKDSDFYGILRPVGANGATIKAIDKESALLLFTLGEAGTLPSYILKGEGAKGRLAQIAALVLDGVLDIQSDGRFVSGPAAHPLVLDDSATEPGRGTLSQLAHDGLRYAQALRLDNIEQLAGRLYGFHRLPLTPRWQRRFQDAESIADHVGLGESSSWRGRLSAWGHPIPRRDASDWITWHRHGVETSASRPTYKLYLSPAVTALEAAVRGVLKVLAARRATAFKLGGDTAGLLRPDKLIVYFDDFDSLSQAAEILARKLGGLQAHGVPFTAEITGDGLLSWGMDPPSNDRLASWQPRESWRLWVVRRLAAALNAAQYQNEQQPTTLAPWRFALERLRLAGVDTERWTPAPTLWNRTAT